MLFASFIDLITSGFEVIFSVFKGVFDLIHDILVAFINFFAGIPTMLLHLVKGTSEALGGLGKFIASNIVVIALIAGGAYVYRHRHGHLVNVEHKKLD
jgi:phage-related protein